MCYNIIELLVIQGAENAISMHLHYVIKKRIPV